MNIKGFLLGSIVFCCIGVLHPVVIVAEYHFGKRIWRLFFTAGIMLALLSLLIRGVVGSIIVGTVGFSLLWSAHEVCEQHKRVLAGHARRNPKRNYENLMLLILPLSSGDMQFSGIIVGAATLLIIKLGHDSVIKAEYYFGKRIWLAYLLVGLAAIAASLFIESLVISVIHSLFGFTSLWGIIEVIEQEKRVAKGWFPKHPKRESQKIKTTTRSF
ncbi:MAG: DUF4491 family protein [Candidatus Limimorpha sp.]